jgi:1-acyl-sn-glycerol-3-phosphate acyltransferase
MALRSGAPLLPVVHFGSENYLTNLRRLRRTDLIFVVGEPFRLKATNWPVNGELRMEITDQVMYQMARLLPPQYRGVYADLNAARQDHLIFEKEEK